MENNYKCDLVKMGKHISELRKNKGLTQKKLAEIIEVNDKSISKWEQGDLAPDITVLKPLADALGVKIDEILCGEKIEEKEKKETPEQRKKRIKRKIIKYLIGIMLIGLIIVLLRKDDWEVTELQYNGKDMLVEGMLVNSDLNSSLIINKIYYKENKLGGKNEKMINNLIAIVYYDEKEVFIYEKRFDSPTLISKSFDNFGFIVNNKSIKNKNKIKIVFSYDKDEKKEYVIVNF